MRDAGLKKIVVVTDDHRDAIRKHLNLAFPNDEIRLVCSARYVKAENRESLVAAVDLIERSDFLGVEVNTVYLPKSCGESVRRS